MLQEIWMARIVEAIGRFKSSPLRRCDRRSRGLGCRPVAQFFIGLAGDEVTADRAPLAPFFAWVLDVFVPFGMIFPMAAAPFAAKTGSLAFGISGRQERQYQALLSAGRQVPPAARVLTWKDWLATVVFLALMAALIMGALVAAYREAAPG